MESKRYYLFPCDCKLEKQDTILHGYGSIRKCEHGNKPTGYQFTCRTCGKAVETTVRKGVNSASCRDCAPSVSSAYHKRKRQERKAPTEKPKIIAEKGTMKHHTKATQRALEGIDAAHNKIIEAKLRLTRGVRVGR